MTVCDSWSLSRRRKSTASSGGGYFVTMKAAFFKKDYDLNDKKQFEMISVVINPIVIC